MIFVNLRFLIYIVHLKIGVLDKMELKLLMKKLGMEIRNEKVNEIFNLYDVDQGGSIDFSEFLTLLKAQNIEATARIHELTEAPVMALKSNPTEEYLPPRTGLLKVSVIDGFAKKDVYRILSTVDRENITNVAHQAVGSSGNIGGSSIATVVGSALECATLRIGQTSNILRCSSPFLIEFR